jgi:hypothetical protein
MKESELDIYNEFERISRHLTAHVIYEFSNFLNGRVLSNMYILKKQQEKFEQKFEQKKQEKKEEKQEDEDEQKVLTFLEDFYNNHFIIRDQSIQEVYKNIPRDFRKPCSFKQDGKIIMTSRELAKRMLYTLLFECRKGFNTIIDYKNQTYVPNYYKNIRDFKSSEDNIIFPNTDSVLLWINAPPQPSYKIHEVLDNDFINDVEKGYAVLNGKSFFKNKLDGVFICCKESSEIDIVNGTLIALSSDKVEVQGSGGDLFLTFMFNETVYLLRMTKYN